MPRKPRERIAEARTESSQAAERITKDNADALGESGSPSSAAAVQELTRAYQELMTKNIRKLTDSMQALAAVKSPAEFMQLQQRLIREGVEAAVSDSQRIAQLTNAVFVTAFEPMKKRFESARKDAQT
jgi:phasin family protein